MVVPQSQMMIDQWKYEIAAELGLPVGGSVAQNFDAEFASELGEKSGAVMKNDGDWGGVASRDVGVIGGTITARLIQKAQGNMYLDS